MPLVQSSVGGDAQAKGSLAESSADRPRGLMALPGWWNRSRAAEERPCLNRVHGGLECAGVVSFAGGGIRDPKKGYTKIESGDSESKFGKYCVALEGNTPCNLSLPSPRPFVLGPASGSHMAASAPANLLLSLLHQPTLSSKPSLSLLSAPTGTPHYPFSKAPPADRRNIHQGLLEVEVAHWPHSFGVSCQTLGTSMIRPENEYGPAENTELIICIDYTSYMCLCNFHKSNKQQNSCLCYFS
jgi:hypothetical protein